MEKISLRTPFEWGALLDPLMYIDVENPGRDVAMLLRDTSHLLKSILGDSRLNQCVSDGNALLTSVDNAWDLHFKLSIREEMHYPFQVQAALKDVAVKASQFLAVLCADLDHMETYYVSPVAAYSTPTLVREGERVIPVDVLLLLPKDAVQGIKESGKCLAFDCPTASAFHILRALEAVVHQYYVVICAPSDANQKLDNLGVYESKINSFIDAEKAKFDARTIPSWDYQDAKEVMQSIFHVRKLSRNIILHRDVFLTQAEALKVFNHTVSLIQLMAERL